MFMSLRSAVRMMVAAQRAAQTAGPAADVAREQASRHLARAAGYLQPSPARLVVVAGLSGTGKSTLAAAVAPKLGRAPGAVHLRSDVERKRQFGRPETERLPEKAYTPEVTAAVYRALCEQAAEVLAAGHSVVVDAVFARPGERSLIEDVAAVAGVRCEALWLEAGADVMKARVSARTGDASDATSATVDLQLGLDLGEKSWPAIDASAGPGMTLQAALAALGIIE
jgi:hypothetical protein